MKVLYVVFIHTPVRSSDLASIYVLLFGLNQSQIAVLLIQILFCFPTRFQSDVLRNADCSWFAAHISSCLSHSPVNEQESRKAPPSSSGGRLIMTTYYIVILPLRRLKAQCQSLFKTWSYLTSSFGIYYNHPIGIKHNLQVHAPEQLTIQETLSILV